MWTEIYQALAPYLVDALMSLVALATGYFVVRFRQWTGIQIEERHRAALHSAIRTGVVDALDRGLSGERLLAEVQDYLKGSVPDALAKLAPGDGVLVKLVRAKVAEALTGRTR